MGEEKKLYSMAEAARQLGVSRQAVHAQVDRRPELARFEDGKRFLDLAGIEALRQSKLAGLGKPKNEGLPPRLMKNEDVAAMLGMTGEAVTYHINRGNLQRERWRAGGRMFVTRQSAESLRDELSSNGKNRTGPRKVG